MDSKLLELLYCPVSQTRLEYDLENQVLISNAAKLVFPIRDGIPVMLESEATPLDAWEKNKRNEVQEHFANVQQEEKNVAEEVVAENATVTKKPAVKKKASKKAAAPKKVAPKNPAAKKTVAKKVTPPKELS